MSDKWIPVKKKVPNHNHRVVVTIYNIFLGIRFISVARYNPKDKRWDVPYTAGKVTAWQEGPDPFNEEEDSL